MHFDWKGIFEGAFNSIFVNENIEKIANERLTICRNCPHDSDNKKKEIGARITRPDEHCTRCGCNIHLKTRSLSQTCPDFTTDEHGKQVPAPRWKAVMTEQEEWRVDALLEEEKRRNLSKP